jgi:hypothetical protein
MGITFSQLSLTNDHCKDMIVTKTEAVALVYRQRKTHTLPSEHITHIVDFSRLL